MRLCARSGARAASRRYFVDMRRLIIDTGVYIDWVNSRRHEDVLFRARHREVPERCGARWNCEPARFRIGIDDSCERLETAFQRTDRVLAPTAADFRRGRRRSAPLAEGAWLQPQGKTLRCQRRSHRAVGPIDRRDGGNPERARFSSDSSHYVSSTWSWYRRSPSSPRPPR